MLPIQDVISTYPDKTVFLSWTVYKASKDDNVKSIRVYRGIKQNASKFLLENNEFPTIHARQTFGERFLHAKIQHDPLKITYTVKLLNVQYSDIGDFYLEADFMNKDSDMISINGTIKLSVIGNILCFRGIS